MQLNFFILFSIRITVNYGSQKTRKPPKNGYEPGEVDPSPVETGFFFGRLLAARNQVTRAQTVDGFEEGTSQELMDITALFNHRTVGFSLGAGASYDISGSFRVSLDVTYNQGLSNLTNQANRYTNETMTLKYMDSLDDMRLQHWNIAWHFIFPLKFVYSGNYKSI